MITIVNVSEEVTQEHVAGHLIHSFPSLSSKFVGENQQKSIRKNVLATWEKLLCLAMYYLRVLIALACCVAVFPLVILTQPNRV